MIHTDIHEHVHTLIYTSSPHATKHTHTYAVVHLDISVSIWRIVLEIFYIDHTHFRCVYIRTLDYAT